MQDLPTTFDHFTEAALLELVTELQAMNEVDIADYLESLAMRDRLLVYRLLDKDKAAGVFATLDVSARSELIEHLGDEDTRGILLLLESDDLVDALGEMPANLVSQALREMDPARRSLINELLHYPEDTVGSFMTVDYLHVHEGASVAESLEAVRQTKLQSGTLNHIYVTTVARRYLGVVPLWRALQAEADEKIESLLEDGELTLQTLEDQELAAQRFKRYSVSALPVVDSEHRLVGIVTADDMAHVLEDEADEDYQIIQGLVPSTKTYLETSVWELSRQRSIWLLVLMVTATVTALVIQRYELVLATSVALTAYIPMLMDSGGNSGSQSSSLITRSLALGEIELRDTPQVLWKEFRVSLVAGSLLFAVNFVKVIFLDGEPLDLALVVSLTLACTVILGKLVGSLLPMFAKAIGADPAIMAGPFVTSIVDTFVLIIYFQFAQFLL